MKNVAGIFNDRTTAEDAVHRLEALGIHERQISFMMSEAARGKYFRIKDKKHPDSGASVGPAYGGLIGIILGTIMAAGAIAIPGFNLIATGSMATALIGLGAGVIAGGVAGTLIGAGIPEHEAKVYEQELRNGKALIVVTAEDAEQEDAVHAIFRSFNADRAAA